MMVVGFVDFFDLCVEDFVCDFVYDNLVNG